MQHGRSTLVRVLFAGLLTACTPLARSGSLTPLPTSPAILEVRPAPTLDANATATAYAVRVVPSPTPSGLYVVREGDALSSIAMNFGTTVAALMAANGLTDPNAIQSGQTLIIPSLGGAFGTPLPLTPVTALRTPTPLITMTAVLTPTPTLSSP